MDSSNKHKDIKVSCLCSTNKAFTIAELMIVLVIIGIISTATYKIIQSKASYFRTKYMAYSAFTNLKNGVNELIAAGCNSSAVTMCPTPGKAVLPILGHDAASAPALGLCDRLANDVFNTIGLTNCALTTSSGFNSTNANFKTTNGMSFYNFGSNPDAITNLYTVYIDIDGSANGNSSTTKDILTFTIGNDGTVLPAYNSVGATNNAYLSASVMYTNSSGNYTWVDNGANYQTAYCDVNGTYPPNNLCAKAAACTTNTCTLSIDKPPGIH